MPDVTSYLNIYLKHYVLSFDSLSLFCATCTPSKLLNVAIVGAKRLGASCFSSKSLLTPQS